MEQARPQERPGARARPRLQERPRARARPRGPRSRAKARARGKKSRSTGSSCGHAAARGALKRPCASRTAGSLEGTQALRPRAEQVQRLRL